MAWELLGGTLSGSECTSQSATGTASCLGYGDSVNVKRLKLLQSVVRKKRQTMNADIGGKRLFVK